MSLRRRPSASGVALQQYLLLHSQREALEQDLKYVGTTSASKTSAPDIEPSQTIDLVYVEEQGKKAFPYQPNEKGWIVTISEGDIEKRAALSRLNNEIKFALTSLLNCEGVRVDERYRGWIQARLMDTERRLSTSRKEQFNERIEPQPWYIYCTAKWYPDCGWDSLATRYGTKFIPITV